MPETEHMAHAPDLSIEVRLNERELAEIGGLADDRMQPTDAVARDLLLHGLRAARNRTELDDIERLSLFKEVADEYFLMSAVFPVNPSDLTSIERWSRAPDRWQQLVRAFALRKFFLQKSDNVHCHKVYRSYLRAVSEPIDTDLTLDDYTASVAGAVGLDFALPDGAHLPRDTVEDLLYGVFLHGDPDRLKRVKRYRQMFDEDWAIREWAAKAHKDLESLRHQIFMAEHRGRLVLDPWATGGMA